MFSYLAWCAVALCGFFAALNACADDNISIELRQVNDSHVVVVDGLPPELRAQRNGAPGAEPAHLLKVYVGEEPAADQPTVLGKVREEEGRLVFRPRFPFKAGLAYRVVFTPVVAAGDNGATPLEAVVRLEMSPTGEPTVVEAVYPSGDVLPENLLKFYVHFSAPMAQGSVYTHVRLLDAEGNEVEYPFVNVGQELWDRSGTRVTLLLDPGRIKRGLRPREEIGPILEEGCSYELVIDGAWRDAQGRPLKDTYRKSFRAAMPDDVQPAPSKWRIDAPPAGSSAPLLVHLEEPLDHAMLRSAFAVLDEHQTPVPGRIQVDEQETLWRYIPRQDWAAGDYAIVVDSSLEDRAGNSIERPFEVDLFETVQARTTEKTIALPFRVR